MSNEKEIFVIGHKNPDTDSICSAIAYAQYAYARICSILRTRSAKAIVIKQNAPGK